MDDIPTAADFFLKDIPNVKISYETSFSFSKISLNGLFFFCRKPVPSTCAPPPTRKEQLQILHVSQDSQQNIMETLRHIHGSVSCTIFQKNCET